MHALATKLGILKTKVPGLTITVERVTEYMSAGSVLVSEKAKALEFLNYVLTSAKDGTFSPNMVKTAAADGNTPPASVPAKFTNPATPLPTISSKTDPNPWELQDVVNTLNLDNLDSGVQTISGISFKMGAIGAYYDSLSGANQTLIKYSLKKTIAAVKAGTHVPGTLLKWTWDELPSPVGSSDDGSNGIAPVISPNPTNSKTDAKYAFFDDVKTWKPIDSSYSYESLLAKAKTLGIEDTVTPGTSGINVRYALTHPSTSNTYNAALNHLNNLIALAKDGKYFPPNLSSAPAYYVQPSDSEAPEYTNSGVLWGFDTDVDIHTASSYLLNMCDTMGVSDVMSGVKGFDGEELSVAAAVQTAYSLPKTSHDLLIKNIISTVKSINAGTHIVGTFSVDKNSLEASTPIRDDEFTNPNAITKIQKTAGSGAVTQSNASATTLNTYLIALGVSNAKWTTSSGAKLPLNTVASNITMGTESERKQFFGMLNKSIEDAKAGKHVPGTFGDGYETQSAEFTDASKVSDVYTVIGTDSAMWFNKIVEPLGIGDAKTGIPNSTGGMHTVKTALSQLRALSSEERITLAKQVNATLKLAKAGTHKPGHYVKYPDTGEQIAPDSPGTVSKAAKLTDIASVAQVQPIYVSDSVFWFSNLAEKLGVLDADTGIPFWKGGTHTVKSALDNFEYLLHSEKKTIAMQMNNDLDLAKAGLHLQGSYSTGAGDGSVDTAPATVTPPPSAAVQAKPPFSTKVKGIHGIGAKTKITKMRQLARMLGILNDVFSKDSPGVSVNTALGLSYSQPNVYASATSYINTKLTQAKKGQYTPASYNVGSTTTAPVPETPKVVHSNPTSIGPAKVMSDGYTDPTYFKTVQDIETYFPTAAFETLAEKLAILNTKSGMFRQGLEMTVGEAIKYYSSMDSMDKEEFVSSMNRTLAFAKAGDHVPTAFHTGYSVNKKLPPVYTPPAAPPAPYVSAPYVHPTFKEKVKGIKGISEKSTWTKRSALINLLGVKKDIIPAFKSDGTPMTVEDALYGNLEHRQAAMLYVNQKLLAAKKGTYTSPIYAAAAAKTVAAQASYSNPAPATSYAPPPPTSGSGRSDENSIQG